MKDTTVLVVYVGEVDGIQNRYGKFTKGIPVELPQAVGEAVLKYPGFQEKKKEQEVKKKGGE